MIYLLDENPVTHIEKVSLVNRTVKTVSPPTNMYPPHILRPPDPGDERWPHWISIGFAPAKVEHFVITDYYRGQGTAGVENNADFLDRPDTFTRWSYPTPGFDANDWLIPTHRDVRVEYKSTILIFATPPPGTIPPEDLPSIHMHRQRMPLVVLDDYGNPSEETIRGSKVQVYGDGTVGDRFLHATEQPYGWLLGKPTSGGGGVILPYAADADANNDFFEGESGDRGDSPAAVWMRAWELNPFLKPHLADASRFYPTPTGGLPSTQYEVPQAKLFDARSYNRDTGQWTSHNTDWINQTGAETAQP